LAANSPSSRLAALAAAVTVVAVAVFASTAAADDRALARGIGCSSFGTTWSHSYNAHAELVGNPVRILSACCRPTETAGINHCFLTVTLAGTLDRGCEVVNIGKNGLPANVGRHRKCVGGRQTVA
jgi:hypothetical protein